MFASLKGNYMTVNRERKQPTSIVIPPDLQSYLQKRAAEGYRSMTQEIIMRLEKTRQAETIPQQMPPRQR